MNTYTPETVDRELIEKLKYLYLDIYKIKLTNEEATSQTIDFLNLMKKLLKKNKK